MSRPLAEVTMGKRKLNAVLDTGSWRSYVRKALVRGFPAVKVQPFESKLGGQILNIRTGYVVSGIVKDSRKAGYRFATIMFPAGDLGKEDGKKIDILFGAITLEDWGTVIDESTVPPRVDYSILRKGALVEL